MKISKLNIEGYIGGADIMSLFSGEETFNLSKLRNFLDNLESDVTDIHVYINSGGGSVNEGWAIYDKLKASGKTITTIGEGMVGSIATIIYMAGSVRKLHENSKFFIHNPYWQADAPTPMEGDDLISLGEDLKNEQNKILDFYSKQTGVERSKIEPLMSKATDLTSTQAIELGFAHSVVNESVNYRKYQLVAMVNIKEKQTNQNNNMIENKGILATMKRFAKKLAMASKGVYVNMEMPVTDEEGNNVTLFIETETEDLVEKPAFIIDAEGNQSPAKDGKYTDASGKVIMVSGNMVKSVEEGKPAEEEANKATDVIKFPMSFFIF